MHLRGSIILITLHYFVIDGVTSAALPL